MLRTRLRPFLGVEETHLDATSRRVQVANEFAALLTMEDFRYMLVDPKIQSFFAEVILSLAPSGSSLLCSGSTAASCGSEQAEKRGREFILIWRSSLWKRFLRSLNESAFLPCRRKAASELLSTKGSLWTIFHLTLINSHQFISFQVRIFSAQAQPRLASAHLFSALIIKLQLMVV